jgi:hypothetical protein
MAISSKIVDKQIIYRYSPPSPEIYLTIGLFKIDDGKYQIIAQQQKGDKLISDDLSLMSVITHNEALEAYSKTGEFCEATFNRLYQDIVNSLADFQEAELSYCDSLRFLDGNHLRVEIAEFPGHKCEVQIHFLQESIDNSYRQNAIYAGFVEVLKEAGFYEWYNDVNTRRP